MLQSILILTVCTVNSHPFLFGCRRDFRMTAIMMMTAIMVMPTSTQLARTEPTTMTIELLFDNEPYMEYKAQMSYLWDVVCFHSPDGIVNGGWVGPASSMLFLLITPTLTVYSTLGSRSRQ